MKFGGIILIVSVFCLIYVAFKAQDENWFADLFGTSAEAIFKRHFSCPTKQIKNLKAESAEWMGWEQNLHFFSASHVPLRRQDSYLLCALAPVQQQSCKYHCCSVEEMSSYENLNSSLLLGDANDRECIDLIVKIHPQPFALVKEYFLTRFPDQAESLNATKNLVYLCSQPEPKSDQNQGTWLVVNKKDHNYFFRDWSAH